MTAAFWMSKRGLSHVSCLSSTTRSERTPTKITFCILIDLPRCIQIHSHVHIYIDTHKHMKM